MQISSVKLGEPRAIATPLPVLSKSTRIAAKGKTNERLRPSFRKYEFESKVVENMAKIPRILFVSAGNSARGQMAEGFARYYAGDRIIAESAGSEASQLNPYAQWVMNEVAVDIKQQDGEEISGKDLSEYDRIILIYDPSREDAPAPPSFSGGEHWPLTDPSLLRGSAAHIRDAFRFSRNEIEHRVKGVLQDLFSSTSRSATAGA